MTRAAQPPEPSAPDKVGAYLGRLRGSELISPIAAEAYELTGVEDLP